MQTQIVAAAPATRRAVELLRAGELVALPTETVYGLAADARNAEAVAKIFEAKERPCFDPLIVHLPAYEAFQSIARIESNLVRRLIQKFWPGPLTLVVPKRPAIPDIVTAGLETVAVRMSAHPVFQQIISAFGGPLAAPSANRFGRVSPTTAEYVLEELGGRIPLIVDGGATEHGIESTIVRVTHDGIEILRPGPITAEMLREFAPVYAAAAGQPIVAPGQLPTHYAPRTRLILVDELAAFPAPSGKLVGALSLREQRDHSSPLTMAGFAAARFLSASGDLREAAANLFRTLRELDAEKLDLIVAERLPNRGIGIAINDRLQRAASG